MARRAGATVTPAGAIPLLDLRILEFGDAVATAVAAHRLAMLGADVVIAEPADGCWLRAVPWSTAASNPLWEAWAGGAHSADDRQAATLIEAADVVLATSSTARVLGLDQRSWDSQLLVEVDHSNCPGELHAQASSGMLAYLGTLDGPPVRAGFEAAGWAGGVVAVQAVLSAAVAGRLAHSGVVRIDMLRVAATLISNQVISHSDPDEWIGFAAYQHQPPEHGFRAAGAWWEIIFFRDDGGWERFCQGLGCPELAADRRFATHPQRSNHKAELAAALEPHLEPLDTARLEDLLKSCGGLFARRVSVAAAARSDQSRANNLLAGGDGPDGVQDGVEAPALLNSPWAVDGRRAVPGAAPVHWSEAVDHAGADWSSEARAPLPSLASPLEGRFVVDVTEGAQGPFAMSLLGDLRACVVKVERPGGEFMRRFGPFRGGEALPFLALNHGRALAVEADLHGQGGRGIAEKLARRADVFVENWRHGTAERLGLGPGRLQEANRDLVYVSASGFGSRGALAGSGALDQISQAASGMWSLSGDEGGVPERFRGALLDYLSALVTVEAVLIGLIHRERFGRAPLIEVSQLASALSVCQPELLVSEDHAVPRGSHSRYFAPSGTYRTADSHWVVIEAVDEEQWKRLRERLGCDALEDDRFATNQLRIEHGKELDEILSSRVSSLSAAHLVGADPADGIVEVHRPLELLIAEDGLLRQRGHVVAQWSRVGSVLRVRPPWELPDTHSELADVGPPLGAHTVAIGRILASTGPA